MVSVGRQFPVRVHGEEEDNAANPAGRTSVEDQDETWGFPARHGGTPKMDGFC